MFDNFVLLNFLFNGFNDFFSQVQRLADCSKAQSINCEDNSINCKENIINCEENILIVRKIVFVCEQESSV